MRSLILEAGAELVEFGLLLQEVLRRGLRCLFLQRQVHALVAPVLLRVPGLDALNMNAQAQPPHAELAQAEQRMRAAEGRDVGRHRRYQPAIVVMKRRSGMSHASYTARDSLWFTSDGKQARECHAHSSIAIRSHIQSRPLAALAV
jgi:hypothetical protein